jgi:ATP-dependent HslUV protease ATP-binding subunit HslU
MNDALTPKAIVAALDEHIVGQNEAKKAVAVALRNRWRRQRLSAELRDEVVPKNILMIGPTGCGKTEISRRLAKLADAPFVKVEATKFTEVGYVGRDVEQIARDLVEEAVRLERERRRNSVKAAAEEAAMDRLLDALTGKGSSEATRASFRQRFSDGSLNTAEVEIDVDEVPAMPFEIPGMGAQMFDLKSLMGKAMGQAPKKRRKLKVPEAFARLTEEEADKRIDPDDINRIALADAEANGIVFLDEIDKIAVSDVRGGSVSREGVQRDLLPLIEGTTVATKYGPLKTDHMLFIASGAFHMAKPADLLPELQGRLPIRVELKALTQQDFVRILSATRASFRDRFADGSLATAEVEIEVEEAPNMPFEIPGMGAQVFDLRSMMGKALGQAPKARRKLKVPDAFARLTEEEADKRLDPEDVNRAALADAEANGIVFLDEIDKIAVSDVRGGSVSREGVQRDLLPLIEGTTVATKYGPIKTDHILFIASGAFHVAKPADLLPELQGRLPIRVELAALTEEDFVRILSSTRASLTEQYCALLGTEGVTIDFAPDGIAAVAKIAAEVNSALENIGARRLSTVMEKLLEDISFTAEDRHGELLTIDAAFVEQQLSGIARDTDLSRYVL